MKSRDILENLGSVDPKLIGDAAPDKKQPARSRTLRLIALAAAAAIVITAVPLSMILMNRSAGGSNGGNATGSQSDKGAVGGELPPDGNLPVGTSSGDSSGGYVVPSFVELGYLTQREFHSDRTVGAVGSDFRAAYADFALKLLTASREQGGSDTLISPLSVMTVLSMAANGASGQTLSQMEALLGGTNIEEINQQLFNLYASLSSTPSAAFKAANSIWLTSLPTFSVSPDFLKAIENTYRADVLSVDFSDSQQAADAVNYWCWEHTDGMIDRIVGDNAFDSTTALALVNALTFDAMWADPYKGAQCGQGYFSGVNGATKVTTLTDWTRHGFLQGENEKGFIREYAGGDYAFVALLPNDTTISMAEYLASLDGDYLMNLISNPDTGEYDLYTSMPAFRQETSLNLDNILSDLGMSDAFGSNVADFTAMGDSESQLYIDEVIHKTFIEVNSLGTRAGAATAVDVPSKSDPPERQERVVLDRPFVYAIIDTATSLPLFIGSCENVA